MKMLFSFIKGIVTCCMVLSVLCITGCSDIETVEQRNDRGQLERFQRNKKTGLREGVFQRFSESGQLLEEAVYATDSLNGARKYFFPNGNLESMEIYTKGVIDGKYKAFYENGALKIEQDFVKGALTGFSIRYYPNGKLQEKVMLKDNVENGPFTEFYENGQLKTEGTYGPDETGEEGLEQGELKEYDESGQLLRIADCKDGRCTTRWKK